jgi:hypothetical protein
VCSSHVGPYAGSFRQVQHSPLQECDLHKTCPHPAACVLYAVGSRASASRTLLNMSAVNSSAFFFFLTVSCLVCVYLCAVQWDPTSGASDNFHKPCYRRFIAACCGHKFTVVTCCMLCLFPAVGPYTRSFRQLQRAPLQELHCLRLWSTLQSSWLSVWHQTDGFCHQNTVFCEATCTGWQQQQQQWSSA